MAYSEANVTHCSLSNSPLCQFLDTYVKSQIFIEIYPNLGINAEQVQTRQIEQSAV